MKNSFRNRFQKLAIVSSTALWLFTLSCSSNNGDLKEEQIRIVNSLPGDLANDTVQANSIKGNLSLKQVATAPSSVILTGMPQHRLVTIYKSSTSASVSTVDYMYSSSGREYESYDSEREMHFMPGLDLIHGYNLLNIAHYDLITEKLTYFFDQPVLVKSLYYPSFIQDSLYKKPVNRNYYLISVYDTDTNQDTLINKKDLRRFYYFNASCTEKIQLLPPDYSVARSQYDPANDVMYVFAKFDTNHNGIADKKEPLHIFWFNLKTPAKAKRFY